jgi:hypothetical protein
MQTTKTIDSELLRRLAVRVHEFPTLSERAVYAVSYLTNHLDGGDVLWAAIQGDK